ncbi:MAG: hypothetical protein ACN6QR_23790, partial [Pseudomonas protegens]
MDSHWTHAFLRFWRLPAARYGQWKASRNSVEYQAPLRSELFSTEQMARHGTLLAQQHRLSPSRTPDWLLARLADNASALASCCKSLTAATHASPRATPAAEWLLDNYYLLEEQIRITRTHLPRGY